MSKLMMVDLAGSEKTRKTRATGQRLDEAKQINKSLSTLGQVISALTTGKYVPYRNSKLTRLLSDSLGGNSKTCIIVTCSPCDYNVEETISTLRFGVNCKRVKNKPKVNEELSIAEYKALLEKKSARENKLLQKIAVLQSQVAALKDALEAAGGNVEEALKNAEKDMAEAAIVEEKAERTSQGPSNQLSLLPTQSNVRMSLANFKSNAAFEMLKERVDELEELYNTECEDKERYMDEAADARGELEEVEQRVEEVVAQKSQLVGKMQGLNEEITNLTRVLGEFRINKSKLELMRNESKLQIQRLREDKSQLNDQLKQAKGKLQEAEMIEKLHRSTNDLLPLTEKQKNTLEKYNPANLDFEKEDNKDNIEKNYQDLYKKLLMEMQTIREMKAEPEKRLSKLNLGIQPGDGKQNEGMLELVNEMELMKRRISELEEEDERKSKSLQDLRKRDHYNDALRKNWRNQLTQMEQAVLLANQIHHRDRIRFTSELAEKDSELSRLKMFLAQVHRKRRKKSKKTGRANNVMVPVDHKITKKGKPRKRREGQQ